MKIVKPEEWLPQGEIELENAAIEAIVEKNNVLIAAGPGAGKTELLAQKACYLFRTNLCDNPRKILAICFKKDAAESLKKRVVKRLGKEIENRFVSLTYDAFAKGLLDRFRNSLPTGNKPKADYEVENFDIIEAAFRTVGYYSYYNKNKMKKIYDEILNSVELPLNNSDNSNVWRKLLNGFDNYNACLSFKMITKLAILIVAGNPYIKKALRLTYSHVFFDEFQDTTDLQYKLLKECFSGSKCILTAVGDKKQRIMVWAGAKKNIFEDYVVDFNAIKKQLIMNHRSAPRLINLQKDMYNALGENQLEITSSGKWGPNDGEIFLLKTNNSNLEEDCLVKNIKYHISKGVQLNDICILCKQRPEDYTKGLIEKLSDCDIKARIESCYQDLISEPIIELLLAFWEFSLGRKSVENWELLENSFFTLRGVEYNFLQKNRYQILLDELITFKTQTKEKLVQLRKDNRLKEIVDDCIQFFGMERIKSVFPSYKQGNRLTLLINDFKDLFQKELTNVNNDVGLAIDNFRGLNSIPIMTIHKSKGLEYSVVYFIGLEDSAFWNFKNQPDEDRCAFFVALSRAKKSVIFTYTDIRYGFKYPKQSNTGINEFYELLQKPGMAKVIYKYK